MRSESEEASSLLERKIQIWERAIQTQMHFAELSIKMRQLGITLAGGAIALAILLLRTDMHYSIQLFFVVIPVSSILCIAAGCMLYWAMRIDVGVYHQMLRGSVKFNELLEQQLDDEIGWRSGLTEAISAYSRFEIPQRLAARNENGTHWQDAAAGISKAGSRLVWSYRIAILALVASGVAIGIAVNFGAVVKQ